MPRFYQMARVPPPRSGRAPAQGASRPRAARAVNGNQPIWYAREKGRLSGHSGDVLELVDRHDLGSCAFWREGSSPSVPTTSSVDPSHLSTLALRRPAILSEAVAWTSK